MCLATVTATSFAGDWNKPVSMTVLMSAMEDLLAVSSGANIDQNHRFKIRQGGTHSSRPCKRAAVLGPIKAEALTGGREERGQP
jgi:hypothetical protein